ncbi:MULTISPECIES: CTB family bacteriocin [unclassified Nodularia (in: cyanobacteria)]|uniref:CTB family bacteriocin n=1 Tax=unclassified Nodularia (in: cyanobacteria) TaxID=2656917 RepID=UPI00188040F0|nr:MULTISPECIES: CTB family bacteriocin [unclassified Nodularia (in: cyanobacteria)]MBE9200593.1 CTB family bacteriocin [Nodularia sp. LEGE 06071]MCC2692503.1 CTB family bacteriocin [Nodularia sp. LEGE 04288]
MFDQLFTEISVEDQETVTGGLDLNASLTTFFAQQTNSTTGAQSGFGGSTAGGSNSSLTVFTTGLTLNYFNGVTPPPPIPNPNPNPNPGPTPGPVNP